METLWQDARYAVRVMMKKRGFTTLAVLTLALGIGANTAIFSVVNAVILRPLSFKASDSLVIIRGINQQKDITTHAVGLRDALDWKEQGQSFDDLALIGTWTFNLTEVEEPERIPGAVVTPNFFGVHGTQPFLGRSFTPEDAQTGRSAVVILSHGVWQRRFGSDPSVIGRQLTLNGTSSTVVGVMPEGFGYPYNDLGIWSPLADEGQKRDSRWLTAVARLKAGVTPEQAQTELDTISRRLEQSYPETNAGWGVTVETLHGALTRDVRRALLVLLGAVGLVLLIACANVATLVLARGTSRRREIAIRAAMGATRGRIVRHLLTESVIVSLAGGALGILLAYWSIDLLTAFAPDNIPRLNEVNVDRVVLGFTFVISLATGVLSGLAPALAASKFDLQETLKEESGAISGSNRHGLRGALMISEVAISLMLLVGAGLLVQSFLRARRVDAGFNPENLLTMQLMLTGPKYSSVAAQQSFVNQTLDKIKAMPGVEDASAVTTLPVGGTAGRVNYSFMAEGRQPREGQDPNAYYRSVSPGYFRTMSIALHKGREFTEQDNETGARVAIINQTMARRIWAGEDPVGRRVRWTDGPWSTGEPQWMTIVGVAADVKQYGLEEREELAVYVPYAQKNPPWRWLSLVVRTKSDPSVLTRDIVASVHAVDKDMPVYMVSSMEQVLSESLGARRFSTLLLALLACVALVLASVGIYGVISYTVGQRTHEIGVRVALGAQRSDILKLVLRHGMGLTLIGIAAGLGASLLLSRLLSSMLFGVSTTDPLTFICVTTLLASVALLACYLPARRATRVDPLVALRYE